MIFKQQTVDAIFAVMVSVLMVFGAFTFTLVEDQINSFLTGKSIFSNEIGTVPSLEIPSQASEEISNSTPETTEETGITSQVEGANPGIAATKKAIMETKIALAPECTIRKGWELYITMEGDTLENLAQSRGVTPPILQIGNCLAGYGLTPGEILYLPPFEGNNHPIPSIQGTGQVKPGSENITPTVNEIPSPTPLVCIHPDGWEPYTIAVEDTIPNLSERFGISIFALQTANCLDLPLVINQGDVLYVPGASSEPTSDPFNLTETPIPPSPTP